MDNYDEVRRLLRWYVRGWFSARVVNAEFIDQLEKLFVHVYMDYTTGKVTARVVVPVDSIAMTSMEVPIDTAVGHNPELIVDAMVRGHEFEAILAKLLMVWSR